MKTTIALFTVVMTLSAAGNAVAQEPADVVYQNALLSRPLAPADKAYCDGKTGAAKSLEKDMCHVTRLFLSDIAAGRDKAFPPKADITYAHNDAEIGKIVDRL